jgi:hypothetical protein
MAGKKMAEKPVLQFVIRADQPGAARAVRAAAAELGLDPGEIERVLREFELVEAEGRNAIA